MKLVNLEFRSPGGKLPNPWWVVMGNTALESPAELTSAMMYTLGVQHLVRGGEMLNIHNSYFTFFDKNDKLLRDEKISEK